MAAEVSIDDFRSRFDTLFVVTGLGRSGTAFLSGLLNQSADASVLHEPWGLDSPRMALRYYGGPEPILNQWLRERYQHLDQVLPPDVHIFGEVNSFLRYEVDWIRSHLTERVIHLVRDGRRFVQSAFPRFTYTPRDRHVPIVPLPQDPASSDWAGWTRFQKLCWYWDHTNRQLLRYAIPRVRFEDLLTDYSALEERVSGPCGVEVSRAAWEKAVAKPVNTTRGFVRRFRRRRVEEARLPHWREWTEEQTGQFWAQCGETMQAMGYSA